MKMAAIRMWKNVCITMEESNVTKVCLYSFISGCKTRIIAIVCFLILLQMLVRGQLLFILVVMVTKLLPVVKWQR